MNLSKSELIGMVSASPENTCPCNELHRLSRHAQRFDLTNAPGNDIAIYLDAHQHAIGRIQMASQIFVMLEVSLFTGLKLNGWHRFSPADAGNCNAIGKIRILRRAIIDHERNVGVVQYVAVLAGEAGRCDKNAPQITRSRKGDNSAVWVPVGLRGKNSNRLGYKQIFHNIMKR
jgi:hypothetical protein